MTQTPRTLYDKIWDAHLVESRDDGTDIISTATSSTR
jgi:homoaconitase/3-isopropylmalate dehydratase large subunit